MKRLSELQYRSRSQGIRPDYDELAPDVTDGDIAGGFENDYGDMFEPEDVTSGDYTKDNILDDEYIPEFEDEGDFFDPEDVTDGDRGLYEGVMLPKNLDEVEALLTHVIHQLENGDESAINEIFDSPDFIDDDLFNRLDNDLTYAKQDGVDPSEYFLISLNDYLTERWPEIKALNESTQVMKEAYGVYRKGGAISDNDRDYDPRVGGVLIQTFDTAEEAKAKAARMRKQLTPGEKNHFRMTYVARPIKEATISPRELTDPESEYSITDDEGNIPSHLADVGGIRNPDNEYNQWEDLIGKDGAAQQMAWHNSLKQRMGRALDDIMPWYDDESEEFTTLNDEAQADWNNTIQSNVSALKDMYGDDEEWDDDVAKDVATTHMYGHPRWDESNRRDAIKARALLERRRLVEGFLDGIINKLGAKAREKDPEKYEALVIDHMSKGDAAVAELAGYYIDARRAGADHPEAMRAAEEEAGVSMASNASMRVAMAANTNEQFRSLYLNESVLNEHEAAHYDIDMGEEYEDEFAPDPDLGYSDSFYGEEVGHMYGDYDPDLLLMDAFGENAPFFKMIESERTDLARQYFDDNENPSYRGYVDFLAHIGREDARLSPQWVNKMLRKRRAELEGEDLAIPGAPKEDDLSTFAGLKDKDVEIQKPKKKTFEKPYTEEPPGLKDPETVKKLIDGILRSQGLRTKQGNMRTMGWEEEAVEVRAGREGKLQVNAYIETGDRGPRTDHGGGDDGDGWMDDHQINRAAEPYYKKWQPRIEKLQKALNDAGLTSLKAAFDYGEKGHIAIQIWGTV